MPTRSLGKMIILSLVTLLLYQIYWLFKTRQELVAAGGKIPPFKLLIAPFVVATALFPVGFLLKQIIGEKANELALPISILVIIVLLSFIPIALYWYFKYCQAVEKVTSGRTPFALTFSVLIITSFIGVGFIWPFIIQDSLNKVNNTYAPPPGIQDEEAEVT